MSSMSAMSKRRIENECFFSIFSQLRQWICLSTSKAQNFFSWCLFTALMQSEAEIARLMKNERNSHFSFISILTRFFPVFFINFRYKWVFFFTSFIKLKSWHFFNINFAEFVVVIQFVHDNGKRKWHYRSKVFCFIIFVSEFVYVSTLFQQKKSDRVKMKIIQYFAGYFAIL
jgi:hypothetical protein